MKRLPLVPTLIVGLAAAAMIALGFWQLRRAEWKEGLLARYTHNAQQPPIAFAATLGRDLDTILFRRTSAYCLEPLSWTVEAGRSVTGQSGWRHIAHCRTGAEGPGVNVDLGVSKDYKTPEGWRGGQVAGHLGLMPQPVSLLQRMIGHAPPPELLVIADQAAAGLSPSAPPTPADIPNDHRGYAAQWFLFAGLAIAIYLIALRQRARR